MTMATYVLLIDTPDGANASIHATQIEAQTALLKFAAEHLAKHGKIVPRDDSDLLEALATFEAEAGDEGKEGELVIRIFTCFADGTSECSGVPRFLTVPRPKEESTEEEIAAAFQSLIDDGSVVPHPDGRQRRNLKGELEPAYVAAEVAAEIIKKQCTPVGPIVVTIRDPGFIGPAGITEIFCSWSCAADWFENQATEVTDDYLKQELSDEA